MKGSECKNALYKEIDTERHAVTGRDICREKFDAVGATKAETLNKPMASVSHRCNEEDLMLAAMRASIMSYVHT